MRSFVDLVKNCLTGFCLIKTFISFRRINLLYVVNIERDQTARLLVWLIFLSRIGEHTQQLDMIQSLFVCIHFPQRYCISFQKNINTHAD